MNRKMMAEGIFQFLKNAECLGDITEDEHLKDTPLRVVKAWSESFLSGYKEDPESLLAKTFEAKNFDEMVVVKDIPFVSMCSHHLLPFIGTAKIGYIPGECITGISKLARVLECFSKRLQVQEKLTTEVANTINEILQCRGVGVVLEAEHLCMTIRGIKKPGSKTVTSCLLGAVRSDAKARQEFLGL